MVMTERERFIKALKRQPIEGHCPTFEILFALTLEAVGMINPSHMLFPDWDSMSAKEKDLQIDYFADAYIKVAQKYHHSAIFVHHKLGKFEWNVRLFERIREKTNGEYYHTMHGDSTFPLPHGYNMMEFSRRIYEDREGLKQEAQQRLDNVLRYAESMSKHEGLLDGFTMCCDYGFNNNSFYTPEMFSDLVAPYLEKQIKAYHDLGYYAVKHSDGNILPLLDQIVDCGPDGLHSLDPQGGVDLSEVKKKYGDRVALCGNVNCALLNTGTEEDIYKDTRRSLRQGMDGWGYVFCTSNCAYTGLPLKRYELMNKIWWEEGIYK